MTELARKWKPNTSVRPTKPISFLYRLWHSTPTLKQTTQQWLPVPNRRFFYSDTVTIFCWDQSLLSTYSPCLTLRSKRVSTFRSLSSSSSTSLLIFISFFIYLLNYNSFVFPKGNARYSLSPAEFRQCELSLYLCYFIYFLLIDSLLYFVYNWSFLLMFLLIVWSSGIPWGGSSHFPC